MQDLVKRLFSGLSPELLPLAEKLVKTRNHPQKLNRIVPRQTLSISVSGKNCEQNCTHCNGHYLQGMLPVEKIPVTDFSPYDSVLISGGSTAKGAVDLIGCSEMLLKLPQHLTLNVHPGFQSPDNLAFLKSRKMVVSFDLPCSDKIIQDVFRLPYKKIDYQELFKGYVQQFRTIPHITIGLEGPECKSEIESVDFLVGQQPEEVVFIVFRPTPGTELANQSSPNLEKAAKVLIAAKERLNCQILLGCMRPSGTYRQNLDILAWLAGIEDFVQPDHFLLECLSENGIEISRKSRCCAL